MLPVREVSWTLLRLWSYADEGRVLHPRTNVSVPFTLSDLSHHSAFSSVIVAGTGCFY